MSKHAHTHMLPNPQKDYRAKTDSGNTLDENKTFGIFFRKIVKQSLLNT